MKDAPNAAITSAAPTGEAPLAHLPKLVLAAVVAVGVALSLFQLYTSGIGLLNIFYQRSIHLAFIMVLAFLVFPVSGQGRQRGLLGWLIDLAFIGGAVYSGFYLSYHLDAIFGRAGFWAREDILAGIITVVVLLEASRRVTGVAITIIGALFIVYAMAGARGALPFLGDFLPGILAHRGYPVERIVAQLYLGQEGIYGVPLGVAATYVFIFILFGAFLEVTGAGKFFIDLAYAAAGRQRGGPAKAAVVASAFMGSISGSSIANVVTTGAFTIPLMKKLGYTPEEAGGVEAAASTGGQIMPPIMGAGAFLIAEYTGLPYLEIVKLSVLPAIMYFATVYLFVDIIAAKRGMRGMKRSELPRLGEVFRGGWHFLLPLGVLVYFLMLNVSPARVGFVAVISVIAVSVLRILVQRLLWPRAGAEAPQAPLAMLGLGAVKLLEALETGARNAIPVSVACAIAGIVVGMIGLTGLGLKFSSLMISFSMGNVVLALLLVALASLVLGLGLPVTAAYIVLAVLTAPALQSEFGIPLVIAHLVIFWYSQDSNVTPPVALAAFAAAGIAKAKPMKTAFAAWKFAKGLYLIPLFMVFNPEIIMGGPVPLVAWNVLTAFAALFAFAAALEGYMFTRLDLVSRLLATIGTAAIFYPSLAVEAAGFCTLAAVLTINLFKARAERRVGAAEPAG
ncbi:MAG: TRAP transporter fused permease subunit [Deinococcota bacterium]|jgi:TRAP transporter 4TM/12TM fusion protein|nr:TRAP transporter fused permease subunit [Deinococcota bacterium]